MDLPELVPGARTLWKGETPTVLELAITSRRSDDHIRNEVFLAKAGNSTRMHFCGTLARYAGFQSEVLFMQKPVPGMSDAEYGADVQRAIDHLPAWFTATARGSTCI